MRKAILLLAIARLAPFAAGQELVWFHPNLWVGTINKGIDPQECWGEIDLWNHSEHVETVPLRGRRFGGKLFLDALYLLKPGEKRSIRIEDPETTADAADGALPQSLRSLVVIDPIPPLVSVELRQMVLRGDQLRSAVISVDARGRKLEASGSLVIEPGDVNPRHLVNIGDQSAVVLMCAGWAYNQCNSESERVMVPAFSEIPVTPARYPVRAYIMFVKPETVILAEYTFSDGTTSTFHVHSGITFDGIEAKP